MDDNQPQPTSFLSSGKKGVLTKVKSRTLITVTFFGALATGAAAFIQQLHPDFLLLAGALLLGGFGAIGWVAWKTLRNNASSRKAACAKIIPILLLIQVVVAWAIHHQYTREDPYFGWLVPANDPQPTLLHDHPFSTNTMFLILGSCAVVVEGDPPSFPAIQYNNIELLTISRNERHEAAISGIFLASDGTVAATLETNRWDKSHKDFLRLKRPDRSTLTITDHSTHPAKEIVSIRYINPNSFNLTCRMLLPDGREVLVLKTHMFVPTPDAPPNAGNTYGGMVVSGGIGLRFTSNVVANADGSPYTNYGFQFGRHN